ncbi:MAG: hypothetical protein KC516_00540 [Nanoarchaeota archaeon]|nr:hypothetical protein [Nanoarchaeota archaeon]
MVIGSFLAFYSSIGGGAFGETLFRWEQAGVFSYLLPFLLIFVLIYGILSTMNIFGNNRGVNAIIAISVGLMALQFNFVSIFFAEIFPKLGMALSVVLVFIILLGFFARDAQGNLPGWFRYVMIAVVGITILVIVFGSLGEGYIGYSGFGGIWYFLRYNIVNIIAGIGVIALVIAVIRGGGRPQQQGGNRN